MASPSSCLSYLRIPVGGQRSYPPEDGNTLHLSMEEKAAIRKGPKRMRKRESAHKCWARPTRKQAPSGERENAKGRKREPEQERGRPDVASVVPQIGSAFPFSPEGFPLAGHFAFSVGRSVGPHCAGPSGSRKGGGPPLRERGASP